MPRRLLLRWGCFQGWLYWQRNHEPGSLVAARVHVHSRLFRGQQHCMPDLSGQFLLHWRWRYCGLRSQQPECGRQHICHELPVQSGLYRQQWSVHVLSAGFLQVWLGQRRMSAVSSPNLHRHDRHGHMHTHPNLRGWAVPEPRRQRDERQRLRDVPRQFPVSSQQQDGVPDRQHLLRGRRELHVVLLPARYDRQCHVSYTSGVRPVPDRQLLSWPVVPVLILECACL